MCSTTSNKNTLDLYLLVFIMSSRLHFMCSSTKRWVFTPLGPLAMINGIAPDPALALHDREQYVRVVMTRMSRPL